MSPLNSIVLEGVVKDFNVIRGEEGLRDMVIISLETHYYNSQKEIVKNTFSIRNFNRLDFIESHVKIGSDIRVAGVLRQDLVFSTTHIQAEHIEIKRSWSKSE